MKSVIKLVLLFVLGLGILGAFKAISKSETKQTTFRTTKVIRGDLVTTIESTGTIEPEKVVDVGAQVSGQIISFGTDANGKMIDYGSEVEEGMVLAKIDDAICQADVDEAKVQVQSAEAGIAQARADLEQLTAKMEQARCDWDRAQKIGSTRALSQTNYDGYKFSYLTAKANVAVGKASLLQAEATLAKAKTALWRAERNLGYCTITSPIKGVVIDRRVNIGQTVVSSMSTSSLFLLAKDLKKMQVWVAVNEADIGKIRPGQRVRFKVDTFPGETFVGEVVKIRLNACMTQNVVTYTVEIATDNSSGKLLPYLTADVEFELQRRNNVLQVSTSALRWFPTSETQVAPEFRSEFASLTSSKNNGKILWVVDKTFVKPINVETGMTNGVMTEVSGQDLKENMKVVIGLETSKTGVTGADASADDSEDNAPSQNEAANNPFTPKMPKPPKSVRPPQ